MRRVNYTRHIGLLITEKTYQQLVKITDEKELPFSQFIRDVLKEKLDEAKEESKQ
jgi:hypothetical protein